MNTLAVQAENGIAKITLNRPHVRNAISMEMVAELSQVLDQYQTDDTIKVLIITAAGTTFASGGDLNEFGAVRGYEESHPLLHQAGQLLQAITNYPKPIIAMINGTCIGGGCELAASCHIRIASADTMLGFVQIGMHITTAWGGGSRLFSLLSEACATAMFTPPNPKTDYL